MEEIERACEHAQRIGEALTQAIELAEQMKVSMGRLAPDELFAAAARREELNNAVTEQTAEMGRVLKQLAVKRGWQELSLAQLTTVAPAPAARLRVALGLVNERAALLRNHDANNRVRGARTLAFLRSALDPQAAGRAAYDRRGAILTPRSLSTNSRTA